MKRTVALLLVCVFAIGLGISALAAVEDTGFTDVDANNWYAGAVTYCRDNGLMDGVTATTFAPSATMTRSMIAAVLYRAADSPAVTEAPVFTDAAAGSWYSSAVVWASENGVIGGYGNGLFGTNDPVTREQIAAILWRYAGSPAAGSAERFADQASISGFAVDAVNWARANGIVGGKARNRFDPQGNATRAEVAAVLMRYLGGEQTTPTPAPTPEDEQNVLVAYFSRTGTTEEIAKLIREQAGGTLFEMAAADPYPSDYTETTVRAQRELDENSRPALANTVDGMENYDVIFLGYPIWGGYEPKLVDTFLESYDFSGKTVVPFCTSGGTGIGSSARQIKDMLPNADVLDGQRFTSSANAQSVRTWLDGLGILRRATE